MLTHNQVASIVELAKMSGDLALKLRAEQRIVIDIKSDSSMVTNADCEVDAFIGAGLRKIHQNANIVSEESGSYTASEYPDGVFVVDPIDGTSSFAKGGDFCINIAYCENKIPTFGLIYIPTSRTVYYNLEDQIYKAVDGVATPIHKKHSNDLSVVLSGHRSLSNSDGSLHDLINKLDKSGTHITSCVTAVAAIKYCLLLDLDGAMVISTANIADWDIAAAICLLKLAGYRVFDSKGEEIKILENKLHQGLVAFIGSKMGNILFGHSL